MADNRAMCDWSVCDGDVSDAVSMEMGEMQFPEPSASKQERKEAEAEADRETDKVKV